MYNFLCVCRDILCKFSSFLIYSISNLKNQTYLSIHMEPYKTIFNRFYFNFLYSAQEINKITIDQIYLSGCVFLSFFSDIRSTSLTEIPDDDEEEEDTSQGKGVCSTMV